MLDEFQKKLAHFILHQQAKNDVLVIAIASTVAKEKHQVRKCIYRSCLAARLLLSCSGALFSLQRLGSNLSFPLRFPGLLRAPGFLCPLPSSVKGRTALPHFFVSLFKSLLVFRVSSITHSWGERDCSPHLGGFSESAIPLDFLISTFLRA